MLSYDLVKRLKVKGVSVCALWYSVKVNMHIEIRGLHIMASAIISNLISEARCPTEPEAHQ